MKMNNYLKYKSLSQISYKVILFLFFLSGLCGLIYEVLWSRYLTIFLGSTMTAYTIVLAVFMGGLALGNFLIGKFADRGRNNLVVYGCLQIIIGVYCALFPLFWKFLSQVYITADISLKGSTFMLPSLKFVFSIIGIFAPAFLMGGTLPLLARYFTRDIREVRHNVSTLYYINSLGGVVGCLLVGFFLIRSFGINASNYLAAGTNGLIGLTALFISYRRRDTFAVNLTLYRDPLLHDKSYAEIDERKDRLITKIVLIGVALSGFTAMVYELAWTRLFSIILGATTYSFTIMLAAFISGITLGSLIISKKKDLKADPYFLFGLCELGIFFSLLLSIPVYQWLPFAFSRINFLLSRTMLSFVLFQVLKFGFCFLVMLLPAIFFGMTLPLISNFLARKVETLGRNVGRVFAFNTTGALLGALTTGLILIPTIGIRHTIEVGFLINFAVVISVFLFPVFGKSSLAKKASLGAISFLIILYFIFLPEWDKQIITAGAGRFTRRGPSSYSKYIEEVKAGRILFYKEGRDATVSVESGMGGKTLFIDGKPEASTLGDMPTQVILGHLPLLLSRNIKDVLVVGVGSGITVGSVLTYPVAQVDSVEISGAVFEAAKYFSPENRDFWKDERVKVHIEDAKIFVKTTDRKYDVIISEPSNPWVSGLADLFSIEFFDNCRKLLTPNGIMAQWFHGYSMDMVNFKIIVRTFSECFKYVSIWETMERDFILIGSSERLSPDFDLMEERMAIEEVEADLSRIRIADLPTLLSRQFVSHEYVDRIVGKGIVNRELNPILEYNAPLVLFKRKKISTKHIDERFSEEVTDLYINKYRSRYPLSAQNYYNMAAFDFKNPLITDLKLAFSLMEKCISLEPENEEFLYDFALLLQQVEKLNYAREVMVRLLQIDKDNKAYRKKFLELTYAIEQEKTSIFYRPNSEE